jgi:hypothetical protein
MTGKALSVLFEGDNKKLNRLGLEIKFPIRFDIWEPKQGEVMHIDKLHWRGSVK